MVLSKAFWLVGLAVLIGGLDSILREYDNEEFFVCFFNPFGGLFLSLRWCFRCSFSYLLEPQLLDLPWTIRALEPILHLRAVRGS